MMKKRLISKIIIMAIVLSSMMVLNVGPSYAEAGEQFLGEVHLMSFNYAPKGWALCRGQILNINQNQALYALIGIKYGGNGVTTFALPNLEAAEPQVGQAGYGMHYCIALQGIFPSRN